MKRIAINHFSFFMAVLTLVLINGCDKNASFSIPEFPEFYGSIFIPQAADNMGGTLVIGNDTTFSFGATAIGDHSEGHARDIHVTIEAMPQLVDSFNTKNGTDYNVMPQANYAISGGDAVIKMGESKSNEVSLKINTTGFTKANTYLLPAGITKMDDSNFVINSKSRIIYFIIKVEKPELRKMVLNLENIGDNPFACFKFQDNLITVSYGSGDGVVRKYKYNEGEDKFDPLERVTNTFISDYSYASFNGFIPISFRYIIIRHSSGDLYGLDGNQINDNSVSFTNSISAFNGGFNIFDLLFPYKGSLFGRSGGSINGYPVDTTGNGVLSLVGGTGLGSGWEIYSQIVPYTNGILCMTPGGDLYYYPVSDAFVVSAPTKVGSGWNKYKRIVPFGDDLLGIDANNDVYRYSFNVNDEWDI